MTSREVAARLDEWARLRFYPFRHSTWHEDQQVLSEAAQLLRESPPEPGDGACSDPTCAYRAEREAGGAFSREAVQLALRAALNADHAWELLTGDDPAPPESSRVEHILVAPEIAARLRADWSEPVQLRIANDEIILRSLDPAQSPEQESREGWRVQERVIDRLLHGDPTPSDQGKGR